VILFNFFSGPWCCSWSDPSHCIF